MLDRRTLIEATDDANERGGQFKREKNGGKKWERHSSANFAALGHFPAKSQQADEILAQLTEGTVLEGPHWTEPVKVLTAKGRGSRVEVQAVGLHTKRLWNKLLKAEDFDGAIKITQAGQLAALNGNPTHFRLAAEAHRIRLAYQYDPHFAVSVSQVDRHVHSLPDREKHDQAITVLWSSKKISRLGEPFPEFVVVHRRRIVIVPDQFALLGRNLIRLDWFGILDRRQLDHIIDRDW
jgi:hypothetical protein